MQEPDVECLICHAPIVYTTESVMMECCMCHSRHLSNARCADGHYICDKCHAVSGVDKIKMYCMCTDSRDPLDIAMSMMHIPGIHMHGPEHHVLIGSALITAYTNSGGRIDLEAALDEMRRRGAQLPGGICGMWGSCGAAISCGIAYSIITGTTPMSEATWGQSNLMTSGCLREIGLLGGPRCCKRDGFTALLHACDFIRDRLGVVLSKPDRVTCEFNFNNIQCIGVRCPYNIESNL